MYCCYSACGILMVISMPPLKTSHQPPYFKDSASKILPPRFCLQDSASKILPPRFCLQDSASKILPPRFCLQDSAFKILPHCPSISSASRLRKRVHRMVSTSRGTQACPRSNSSGRPAPPSSLVARRAASTPTRTGSYGVLLDLANRAAVVAPRTMTAIGSSVSQVVG